MATIHVLPQDDIKEHTESNDCECKPTVRYVGEGGKVVIHNSYDGREFLERWEEEKTERKQ
jgi:hypothetical protein